MKQKFLFLFLIIPFGGQLMGQTISAGMDVTICKEGSTQLHASVDPIEAGEGACFYWKSDNPDEQSLTCLDCQNPVVNPTKTTTYTLFVTGKDFSFKKQIEVKVTVLEVSVSSSTSISAMCSEIILNASLNTSNVTSPSYQFEIKSTDSDTWYSIGGSVLSTFNWTPKVAGKFKLRTIAIVAAINCDTSDEIDIEILFPNYNDIISDIGMSNAFNVAWSNTLNATTPTSRREEGFWIFFNSNDCTYSPGLTIVGETVDNNTTAGIDNIGDTPTDNPINPSPNESALYTIGFFHTHTPMTYRIGSRTSGPSNADTNFHTLRNVVGVVFDYSISLVPGGYPLNSPGQLYQSGPFERTNQ